MSVSPGIMARKVGECLSSFFNRSELTLILIHFIKYCSHQDIFVLSKTHTQSQINFISNTVLIIVMFKHYAITGCTPVLISPSKPFPELPDSLILPTSFMVQLCLLSSTVDVCVFMCIPPTNTCASTFSLGPRIRGYF